MTRLTWRVLLHSCVIFFSLLCAFSLTTRTSDPSNMQANPSYPLHQIAKALQSPDDKRQSLNDNQDRRETKIAKWKDAFDRMMANQLQWGSRKPIEGVPVWATPEVLQGGFASGRLLASLDAEKDTPNADFLTVEGAKRLALALETGCFRIQYPEHGALLAITWLLQHNRQAAAEAILAEIVPYFDRIRFYPEFTEKPLETPLTVSVQSVDESIRDVEDIQDMETNRGIPRIYQKLACRNAVLHWLPLKFDLLALYTETIDADSGWPCQNFPGDWMDRAGLLLKRYDSIIEQDDQEAQSFYQERRVSTRPLNSGRRTKGSTVELIDFLKTILTRGPECLTGRDVGLIRKTLNDVAAKHGVPGSTRFEEHVARVKHSCPPSAISQIQQLLEHLRKFAGESGLSKDEISSILQVESEGGSMLPSGITNAVQRARLGTIKELVEAGNIKSSEMLAALVPAISAQTVTASVSDPGLRRLCYALRMAFSSRRSLLLFDLQSQVKLSELPWYKALERELSTSPDSDRATTSWKTLQEIAKMALEEFPYTNLPNKLLQSFRDLSACTEYAPMWTDELAADIFMGEFSPKFAVSACDAARLLSGTPYETYYNLTDVYARAREGCEAYDAKSLQNDCVMRSGVEEPSGWYRPPSENGKIIEQQMIICTHNLAGCYEVLGLNVLDSRALALKTWRWIVRSLTKVPLEWHGRLLHKKNIGYAWRHFIFFVSMTDPANRIDLVAELQYEMADSVSRKEYIELFDTLKEQFLDPLSEALDGQTPEKQCLGWS